MMMMTNSQDKHPGLHLTRTSHLHVAKGQSTNSGVPFPFCEGS